MQRRDPVLKGAHVQLGSSEHGQSEFKLAGR